MCLIFLFAPTKTVGRCREPAVVICTHIDTRNVGSREETLGDPTWTKGLELADAGTDGLPPPKQILEAYCVLCVDRQSG